MLQSSPNLITWIAGKLSSNRAQRPLNGFSDSLQKSSPAVSLSGYQCSNDSENLDVSLDFDSRSNSIIAALLDEMREIWSARSPPVLYECTRPRCENLSVRFFIPAVTLRPNRSLGFDLEPIVVFLFSFG